MTIPMDDDDYRSRPGRICPFLIRSGHRERPGSIVSFFGAEVRDAMDARADHLVEEGLARRQGQRVIVARDLLSTLQRRELEEATARLSADTGLAYHPAAEGERVAGVYRERVTLASGRFAMIDDGLGFQLVPWRPALEKNLGREVRGVMAPGGRVDWDPGRKRGLGL